MPRLSPVAARGAAWAFLGLLAACADERRAPDPAPVYEDDVEHLLSERCAPCHLPPDAAAGYRVGSYGEAIGCRRLAPGQPVVVPAGPDAPLLRSLREGEPHEDLLEPGELAVLDDWVMAGTPLRADSVHGGDILRPDAPGFHGRLAAVEGYGPLRDPEHDGACGRCHESAPVAPAEVRYPAPGATGCAQCHDGPGAALACGTCHGQGARPYPPRAGCWSAGPADAHAIHVEAGAALPEPLECARCHPGGGGDLGGRHGDGHVDVAFAPAAVAGAEDAYDPQSGRCAVYCHAGLGASEEPVWTEPPEAPAGCDGCHDSPPEDHYGGPCAACHAQVDGSDAALLPGALHLNGRVDLGNGEDGCAACHGDGESGFPGEPVHRAHRTTALSAPVPCAACHPVPGALDAPGHLDSPGGHDPADVVLDPAIAGESAGYEAGSCTEVRCHGSRAMPWAPVGGLGCDGCHGAPPPAPHPNASRCSDLICHGSEVRPDGASWAITEAGRALHVDGQVQTGAP